MERKIEREWKSILCPGEKDKTWVMVEWDIVTERGGLLKRRLRQIDCHHPRWTKFGEEDCEWECEGLFRKSEK